MARRKAQRSSFGRVRKKGKRWYSEYTGPDTAIHTPGHSFATKTDADGWIAAERHLIDLGTWEPPKTRRAKEQVSGETVGQWLDRFHVLLERRPTPLRESTMQTYRQAARVRITQPCDRGADDSDVCSLREIRLAKLTKADVYRWWDGVQRCYPDTPTTNQHAYSRLRAACAEAVEREMLKTNPVMVKEAGKRVATKEKYLPTDAEIAAILDNVNGRYRALTSLMLHHGLRIGEAIALEQEDVRVEEQPGASVPRVTVQVKQNAQRISGGGGVYMLVQPPKTKAGYREVPIMAADVPLFLEHLEKYVPTSSTVVRTPEGERDAFLFTATNAGKMVMDTSYRSVLARAKQRAGVSPDINPHTGRNWLITRLAEQGAHLKEIGRLLGQDDVTTILNVYLKVRAERTTSLMDKVNDTLEVRNNG